MKIRWILGLSVLCTLLVISVSNLFAEKTWTQKADMPTARFNFGTCVVGGKVFAIGGEADKFGDISIATVEVYDPKTDTWERKADMPTARAGVSTFLGAIVLILDHLQLLKFTAQKKFLRVSIQSESL